MGFFERKQANDLGDLPFKIRAFAECREIDDRSA